MLTEIDYKIYQISTHTPLAGRTFDYLFNLAKDTKISTHTPLAGRTVHAASHISYFPTFQLTRPSRGAPGGSYYNNEGQYISTHTPLAGRTIDIG